jgi:DNA-binding CsgD family transcriptional regulator
MAKVDLLRVQDVRNAYRLIGDCRDLGSDPAQWQHRMLEGVGRLIGAPVATGGEGRWSRPLGPVEILSAFETGLDARGHEVFVAYHRELGAENDPIFRALPQLPGRHVVRTRRQLVADKIWYRSMAYEYRRATHVDDQLTSVFQISQSGAISGIALLRDRRDLDFSPRQQRLLKFFHGELGAQIGRTLVSASEPQPDGLSPRLRQTLVCLLEGDSEKQAAARLGLSQATTHQYVTSLYRRFGVQSRAQLMAHAIRRLARSEWKSIMPR